MRAGLMGRRSPTLTVSRLIAAIALMLIYTIVLLVFYCLPGTPGTNNYGPDPYGAHENLEGVFS